MTPLEAKDAILAVFLAVWGARPAVYDDVPGDIPAGEVVWARATIRHATGRQATLAGAQGARRFRAEGTVFVQVFAPVGDGSTACYAAALEVKNAYEDARNSGVWFRDVRLNEVGASGGFEQINVLATFSYDEVR